MEAYHRRLLIDYVAGKAGGWDMFDPELISDLVAEDTIVGMCGLLKARWQGRAYHIPFHARSFIYSFISTFAFSLGFEGGGLNEV